MKILVVDDQADARLIQKTILEQKQFEVLEAENGKEALATIKVSRPDLIISDIMMPHMDGFELCKKTKAIPELSHIPFVFYSAHFVDQHDFQLGEELDAAHFLVKPLPAKQFIAEIEKVILDTEHNNKKLAYKKTKTDKEFESKHKERLLDTLLNKIEKIEQSEQRFKHVINSVPAAIYETSFPDLTPFFFSPIIEDFTGFNRSQFNDGTLNWYGQIYSKDRTTITEQILLATQEQKPRFRLEYRMYHADGKTLVWFEDNGTIEYDNNGKATQIYGTLIRINDRKEAEEKLLESFESTITAVSLALEKRDPYTAGHQHNCARIAKAIAQQMGLEDNLINGLYQAASIHDIGKIYIPSEILNKPTRLSNAEFGLIKTHAQVGYDIVKHVQFPWPIANTILQHHERLDGSGYPNGCKADEICIEAKILAVADVVDAMSSDRPYRKGLGIDAALSELEKNVGIFYDTDTVNACLQLFREKNFPIKNEPS